MFKKLFGQKQSSDRKLTSVNDLLAGDIISFKERLSLPEDIQGQQFEVSNSAGYYYSDGLASETVFEYSVLNFTKLNHYYSR